MQILEEEYMDVEYGKAIIWQKYKQQFSLSRFTKEDIKVKDISAIECLEWVSETWI